MEFDQNEHSHRRMNPLTGEWVLVSPHRSKRPWQGQVEPATIEKRPEYVDSCYLCPGNTRANGEVNPNYSGTFTFVNDYSALISEQPEGHFRKGLLQAKSERGRCKVVCFHPRHDLTIPQLSTEQVLRVVETWIEEMEELKALPYVRHIQIFENKGATMGCSNPHPHGQIWSQSSIPGEALKKGQRQYAYFQEHGRSLLSDYIGQEAEEKERIIFENDHFMVLVPYWAVWPYEAMIIPKRSMPHISDMTPSEQRALADAYRRLTIRYDNLFQTSFPYSAGIHQAPFDGELHPHWHWHMVFFPPLLRSATVKKFMVGYELLGEPQRDITAEYSANRLRGLSEEHYLNM